MRPGIERAPVQLFSLALVALVVGLAPHASAEEPNDPPPVVTVGPGGLDVRSADGVHGLRLGAYTQLVARGYIADEDQRGLSGLAIRRLRPDLRWTSGERFTARLQMDFAGNRASIYDAYVTTRVNDNWSFVIGQQKVPLGLEQLQSPPGTLFVERSLVTVLVPNRDIGATARWISPSERIGFAAGVFNGIGDNTNASGLDDEALEWAARIYARPLAGSESAASGLELGIAGTWSPGNSVNGARPLSPRYRTAGRYAMFRWADEASPARGDVWRGTAHLWLPVGPVRIMAEGVASSVRVDVDGDEAELAHFATHLGLGYVIGGTPGWRNVQPDRPMPAGPGAWEIKARGTSIHFSEDAFDGFAAPGSVRGAVEGGVGVTWWATSGVRWMVDAHHTVFDTDGAGDVPAETVVIGTLQIGL